MHGRSLLLAKLVVLDIALFALSGIPALRNADSGWKLILGGIGWFGGLLCTLVLIVLAIIALVQGVRRRPHATSPRGSR